MPLNPREKLPRSFTLVEGQCCILCNPLAMADHETACIHVESAHPEYQGQGVYICTVCIELMWVTIRAGTARAL